MHYESVTFSSLITFAAGWSRLWQEAPGGQVLLTASRAQARSVCFHPSWLARLFLGQEVSLTVMKGTPHNQAGPLWVLLIPVTFAESPYPSLEPDIIASSFM